MENRGGFFLSVLETIVSTGTRIRIVHDKAEINITRGKDDNNNRLKLRERVTRTRVK